MSSLFRQLINRISSEHDLIIEQGPPPAAPATDNQTEDQTEDQPIVDDSNIQQQTDTNVDNQIEQPEDSNLPDKDDNNITDSKELLYIRLIYKALVTELDPSQYVDMVNMKDINSNNAKEVLSKLETIINNNTSID